MNFNDLLRNKQIDPKSVLAFRHRPSEPKLCKMLPWLAMEAPEVYNAYQQSQRPKVEKAMLGARFVASFVGHEPGKALFVGLYSIDGASALSFAEYWKIQANVCLRDEYGVQGFLGPDEGKQSTLWFNLNIVDFYRFWKGKLVVEWPPPERSWWRRAHRNEFAVLALHEQGVTARDLPKWDDLVLSWEQLRLLPSAWKTALSQWRGIYYIFDATDGKGYVGAAYGEHNLLGRWQNYAATGHGGNRRLRKRNPKSFHFSVLQLVPHDLDAAEVLRLEGLWKDRLHTRGEHGLNEN